MLPALDWLTPVLAGAEQQFGRRPSLFGYGQGAMLAYGISAQRGYLVDHVVAVSGWLPPPLWPIAADNQSVQFPSIVGVHAHAEGDAAVPISFAIDTLEAFELAGADVDFIVVDEAGPHMLGADPDGIGGVWAAARGVIESWT